MDEYKKIISSLKTKGVSFTQGMSLEEIGKIEGFYSITFPDELKHFYSIELPTSNGFYNWRDTSDSNVALIRGVINRPIEGLQEELKDNFQDNDSFWCDKWGEKPNEIKKANEIMLKHYNNAPKLIPVCLHRYIPFVDGIKSTPVFSIMGTDVIYYGENLISYLEMEFDLRKRSDLIQDNCKYIDFWSDLL
ncbi:MAG: hypothetical protein FWH04_10345 [Oscillospiraceae bacterium]|nr:hypothetical protein [Oscillospiraceae bacterium]